MQHNVVRKDFQRLTKHEYQHLLEVVDFLVQCSLQEALFSRLSEHLEPSKN